MKLNCAVASVVFFFRRLEDWPSLDGRGTCLRALISVHSFRIVECYGAADCIGAPGHIKWQSMEKKVLA